MAAKRCEWYELVQFVILLFTMSLMLSKHYHFFGMIFSVFYESEFSIISVVVGFFSLIHGFIMLLKSFKKAGTI
jgi:hypothetical protein